MFSRRNTEGTDVTSRPYMKCLALASGDTTVRQAAGKGLADRGGKPIKPLYGQVRGRDYDAEYN